MLADWLVDPPRTPLPRSAPAYWLVFPLVYLAYGLARGAAVDWYPYPFMDPRLTGGYGRIAGACTVVAAVFVGLAWLLWKVGNHLSGRRAADRGVHT